MESDELTMAKKEAACPKCGKKYDVSGILKSPGHSTYIDCSACEVEFAPVMLADGEIKNRTYRR